jgi:hypothetical protein
LKGAMTLMSVDIFEFWSQIDRGARIHPADKRVFDRMRPEKHGFRLDCLPACFTGSLRDAPVVLLYLSPLRQSTSYPG